MKPRKESYFVIRKGGGQFHFAFCILHFSGDTICKMLYFSGENKIDFVFVYFFEKELDFVYFRGETDTLGLFQERNK